jgi:hypothetical protein
VITLVARSAYALALTMAGAGTAGAARVCELPATYSLPVEERAVLDSAIGGVVVTGSPAPGSGLHVGDVIRQANGRGISDCRELEAAAADALAKGLLLLLAADRDGHVVAVALKESGVAVAVAVPPAEAPAGSAPVVPQERAKTVPPVAAAPVPAMPVPVRTPPPVVLRETTFPPRADASAELTAKAVAAAALLGTVDEAGRFAVPLSAYERRLEEAENAIAALHIEGQGSAAVRAVIAEAVGYHETARDIRRYKAAELEDARIDQRRAVAVSLPYFSDSEVPRWIERYPFLSESLQQAPRTTHMLLPGEMAGRWNPDHAVELLWERAGKAATRLGAWGAGT